MYCLLLLKQIPWRYGKIIQVHCGRAGLDVWPLAFPSNSGDSMILKLAVGYKNIPLNVK